MTNTANKADNTHITLTEARYGKSEVRLVKVVRNGERHEIRDLNVHVALQGDFDASYVDGDNTGMMATDTMRNTVYALAKSDPLDTIEQFGLALVDRFLHAGARTTSARVQIAEYGWSRIRVDGREHDHSFTRDAGERIAIVSGNKTGARTIEAGIDKLLILKTTNSGWENFHHDQYTTLPDAHDRIFATNLSATWSYVTTDDLPFNVLWHGVRDRILATFTDHYSPSVQNTLYRMGRAVLEAFPAIAKIHFLLPNKHHLLYDLARFGMENNNEIFHVTNEPYGLIEGTIERR
jgi:urate oxidase